MSLFSKVINRAETPGVERPPSAHPKGMAARLHRSAEDEDKDMAAPLRRMDDEDPNMQEAPAAPLRREEEAKSDEARPLSRAEEEESAQPLRRADEEEQAQAIRRNEDAGNENEDAQALRRSADKEEASTAQPLLRAEQDEDVQTLRRAQGSEEEEAQALRRSETNREEEAAPLRRHDDPQAEEESAQALRRMEESPQEEGPAPQTPPGASADARSWPSRPNNPLDLLAPPSEAGTQSRASASPESQPPKVMIDQIDVVIHEDAAPASAATSGSSGQADLGRMLNTRYLRGL